MNVKNLVLACAAFGALSLTAVPTVSNVTWSQASSGLVVIRYTLSGAPAVVTIDVLTNAVDATGGASIGAENFANVTGDVNCRVAEDGDHEISWKPSKSWPDHVIETASVRMAVTAWDVAHPPAYMVVDLAEKTAQRIAYHTCEAALPGGITNDVYRQTKMVLRRIDAEGLPWTWGARVGIGASSGSETFSCTLTNDYYMGVFEVTKAQWTAVTGYNRDTGITVGAAMRPQTCVSYVNIRCNDANSTTWGTDTSMDGESGGTVNAANSPNANSFLGKLRLLTNRMKFDLPTEAEWEYAAKAGHGAGYWGDGSPVLDATTCANLDRLGRYAGNGSEPATVGSYKANDWGLYDMEGNVREQCRDWWCTGDGHTLYNFLGALHAANHDYTAVVRGGGWKSAASGCVPTQRTYIRSFYDNGTTGANDIGFRVVLPVNSLQ